ncbi:hypothetical protein T439DRAFT_383619 [Meredithblackwellia eburnea MCA 4105]
MQYVDYYRDDDNNTSVPATVVVTAADIDDPSSSSTSIAAPQAQDLPPPASPIQPQLVQDDGITTNTISTSDYRQSTPGPSTTASYPVTPEPMHRAVSVSLTGSPHKYGPTIKVIQWTPQHGDEGTQVTIVLDSLAIRGCPIPGAFGPAQHQHQQVSRRFVVLFGQAPAPTRFTRANFIEGNGVGTSMSSGTDEQDAFVVLTTFVPNRQSMGQIGERVMVLVQIVDEQSRLVEECIVGEWEPTVLPSHPVTPPRHLKRPGDELENYRDSPSMRSPAHSHQGSPMVAHTSTFLTPSVSTQHLSPRPNARARSTTPGEEGGKPQSANLRHPPVEFTPPHAPLQPDLLRTSQIPSGPVVSAYGGTVATYSNKAVLKLQGDLNQMAMGWSNEEWTNRRRLIQFWRQQEGNVINATFRPIAQQDFVPNSIVISCIFRDEWNECFVTSVDTIYLLEALVGVRFTVEEKNRIRRNLEGFKPMTVSKSKVDSEPFFKLIMGFPNPKPRNIEKDVKVFPWKVLSNALKKIIGKYSATYSASVDGGAPTVQIGSDDIGGLAPSAEIYPHSPLMHSPQIPTYHSQAPSPVEAHHMSPSPSQHHQMSSPAFGGRNNSGTFDYLDPSYTPVVSTSGAGPTVSAYASGPPEAFPHSTNLFPAHEDYGIPHDAPRLQPPPMNHSRSYSEQPRRPAPAPSSFGQPYPYVAEGGEFYTHQQAPEWEPERRMSETWKSGPPYSEPRRSASTDASYYER